MSDPEMEKVVVELVARVSNLADAVARLTKLLQSVTIRAARKPGLRVRRTIARNRG